MRTCYSFLSVLLFALTASASAQEAASRAEEQARLQAVKAGALHPEQKSWVERQILQIESGGGFASRQGVYVTFGDIKKGSGFAGGPAYSKLFDNGTTVDAKFAYSIRNFKAVQLAVHAPPLATNRLHLSARVRWQDAPTLAFYALGTPSPNTRADYAETKTEASAAAAYRPVRLLRFGGSVGFERFDTGPGGADKPRIETFFTGVPGLNADPDYLHTSASAAIDSRDGDGYSRGGTLLQATLHDYRQQDDGPYSFQRVDATAEQYLPILHGNSVFYFTLRGSITTATNGNEVPFFLMPSLGGGDDLRGYGNYRFRDRNSMLFTAEYRWYAQEFLDIAIFYDAGKAVANRRDLDFSGLQKDVGGGIRLHGPQSTVLRVEVAHGNEGVRLILAFSPVGG